MIPFAADLAIAASLTGLGLWTLANIGDPLRSVLAFVVFTFAMMLVWVRLSAPDLALAEAAVAGVVASVVLFDTLGRLRRSTRQPRDRRRPAGRRGVQGQSLRRLATESWMPGAGAILALIISGALGAAAIVLPDEPRIGPLVSERLEQAGASNPVTAVLLNFRAHDTLLEVTVLFTAAMALFLLSPAGRRMPGAEEFSHGPHSTAIMTFLAPYLALFAVLLAGHLWFAGTSRPGGAFQAGTALAASGIGLALAGWRFERTSAAARSVMGIGLFGFAIVAIVPTFAGLAYLELPGDLATMTIVAVEGLVMVSIGFCLGELVFGVPSAAE